MFSSKVKSQIEFFKNKKPIEWSEFSSEEKIRNEIENNTNFFFYTNHEVYSNGLDTLIQIISEYPDKEILISMPVSNKIKYGMEPIVNLLHYANLHKDYVNPMKELVIWQLGDYLPDSHTIGYFDFINESNFKNLSKSNKGILSVRKYNKTRDKIFNKINFDKFNGIIRYIRVETYLGDYKRESLLPHHYEMNKNPTTSELVKEYCKSFVSFVIETDTSESPLNPITDKTLLPFLTQSIPIIYGGCNFVKEVEEMGFWVANKEFGFNTDSLYYSDDKKINNFVEMVNTYNELSYGDIKSMYKKNYSKIKKNYDIMCKLFFK